MATDPRTAIFRSVHPPLTTLLSSQVPTEEGKKASFAEARRYWQDKTTSTLFALARNDRFLAQRLCKEVAQLAIEDDALRVMFTDWMKDRKVAPKGRRKEWNKARHHFLLVQYYSKLMDAKEQKLMRSDVLDALCESENIKTHGGMENRLQKALKDIPITDLPDFIQEFARSA